MSEEKLSVPEKLPAFMRALVDEACQISYVDVIARWGVDYETEEYLEIVAWFKEFGVNL